MELCARLSTMMPAPHPRDKEGSAREEAATLEAVRACPHAPAVNVPLRWMNSEWTRVSTVKRQTPAVNCQLISCSWQSLRCLMPYFNIEKGY